MSTSLTKIADSLEVALPDDPFWSVCAEILQRIGVRLVPIDWGKLVDHAEFYEIAKGPAQGSPYPAFAHDDVLYVSQAIWANGLAHETGHCVVWAKNGKKPGYNFGLDPDQGTPEEYDACAVEVYLLTQHTDLNEHDMLREHFNIGILTGYDPDDEDIDEDSGELAGEAGYAWEEWYAAIREGKKMVDGVFAVP